LRLSSFERSPDAASTDRLFHRAHDQALAELGRPPVAELDHFREVMPGVDVQQRERKAPGPERLLGQAQQADRILAAGEEQHRVLALAGDLAQDVDGSDSSQSRLIAKNRDRTTFFRR